jgi:hypothetical protein
VNSILSIRPVSIAAMRTFRANGEAGEKVSFIFVVSFDVFFVMAGLKREARLRARCPGHPRLSRGSRVKTWMPGTRPGMTN